MTPSALALTESPACRTPDAERRVPLPRPRPTLRVVARPSSGRRLDAAQLAQLLDALDLRRRRAQIKARTWGAAMGGGSHGVRS